MRRVTSDGLRAHDSIRQHGGPETARRVLVVGHTEIDKSEGYLNDLFHLDARNARELRTAIDEFLAIEDVDRVLGGGARKTSGDLANDHAWQGRPRG